MTTPAPKGTALLTIPEVAAELRVQRSTVYRWITLGLLPTVHVGPNGHTRVERKALDAYIEQARRERNDAASA